MSKNGIEWPEGRLSVSDLQPYQVLVGNGPNQAFQKNSGSWEELLKGIAEKLNITWTSHDKDLPFPLLYEFFLEEGGESESALKGLVAEGIADIEPGPLTPFFRALDCQNVLTTNYDEATAIAVIRQNYSSHSISVEEPSGPVKETVYSLFRYVGFEEERCWQIHGSEHEDRSVVLGYDSYSKYMSKIKGYLDDGVSYQKGEVTLPSLKSRLKDGDVQPVELQDVYSWIDFFFLPPGFRLYILGLSMDFVEMHLWWLLTHRSRMQKSGYGPFGKIIYLHPSFKEEEIQSKKRLLEAKSVDVIPVSVKNGQWEEYYLKAARKISSKSF